MPLFMITVKIKPSLPFQTWKGNAWNGFLRKFLGFSKLEPNIEH